MLSFMRNITMNEGEKHMGTKIMYNHKAIEKKWREKWAGKFGKSKSG